jgi:RNA methyltransferase, TrmH family
MARHPEITSAQNPLLKEVRRAAARGSRTADGLLLAETFHLLEEALRSGLKVPVVLAERRVLGIVERHVSRLRDTKVYPLPDGLLESVGTTESAQGVLALVEPPEWTLDHVFRGKPLVVILDGIQDPGNAGTIARAAEAFGATGLLCLKGSVSPWNPKTIRASAGSLFRVPFVDGLDIQTVRAALKQRRVHTWIAVPRGGQAAPQADWTMPSALVVGSEGRGVSTGMSGAGLDLHVPTTGVESLNAAVAASIVLYEAMRQRKGP